MIVILESEGVRPEDARVIAQRLRNSPAAYAKTMIEKELGLEVVPDTVRWGDGVTMGVSYIVASIVPLIAYFFLPLQGAFVASLVLTFLCLMALGVIRGRLAKINLVKSAIEVVIVGTVSGFGGYLLGIWLPKLFGY